MHRECYLPAAGFLYSPGDYDMAVSLTKQLVRDQTLRERVGGAARLEVGPTPDASQYPHPHPDPEPNQVPILLPTSTFVGLVELCPDVLPMPA